MVVLISVDGDGTVLNGSLMDFVNNGKIDGLSERVSKLSFNGEDRR